MDVHSTTYTGGIGSGGRIAIRYNNWSNKNNTVVLASSGNSTDYPCAAGTIFLAKLVNEINDFDNLTNEELIIDNNNIDAGTYYFGNLDNRHITLTKGIIELKQMGSDGNLVLRNDVAGLQTIHEEYTGNITSYSSQWNPLEVLGVY